MRKIELENVSLSEILGLFVNTMTANDKYTDRDSENFLQPIQM